MAIPIRASWRHHPVPMVAREMKKEESEESHGKISSEVREAEADRSQG